MNVVYQIKEKDFIAAAKLAGRGKMKLFYYAPVVFLILKLSHTFLLVEGADKKSYGEDILLFLLVSILVVVSILLIRFVFNPILFRWIYRRSRCFTLPLTVKLNSDGLRFEQEDSVSDLKWERVHKWNEDKNSVIVYSQPLIYHVVPKRLAAEGFEINALVDKLQQYLPRNRARKK